MRKLVGLLQFLDKLAADTHGPTQTFCPADLAEQKMQSAFGGINLMFQRVTIRSLSYL